MKANNDHIKWRLHCPECKLSYVRKNSESPRGDSYRDRVQNCPECSTEVIPANEC